VSNQLLPADYLVPNGFNCIVSAASKEYEIKIRMDIPLNVLELIVVRAWERLEP